MTIRCGHVELAASNRSVGNEVHQEQQNDGADRGADDLAGDARKMQKARQQSAPAMIGPRI
jgi:hypothetical protein